MALNPGQMWSLYLLMATHSNATDGKSPLRVQVETDGSPGALRTAAQKLDPSIQNADIGDLPLVKQPDGTTRADLSADNLRTALGFPLAYGGGGGPCPNSNDQQDIFYVLKHSL